MIIYAGQPNNFLPRLVKDLQSQIQTKSNTDIITEFNIEFFLKNTFSTLYSIKQDRFYTLSEMLASFISFEGARIDLTNYIDRNTRLVTGIMSLDIIKKHNNDFLFTFISNPIDRVYDMFYFIKAILANQTALRVGKDIIEFFIPNFTTLSLNAFIDYLIEQQGYFLSADGSVRLCLNIFLQPKLLYRADFIGVKEKLKPSIIQLNSLLDVDIDPNRYDKFIDIPNYQYRRYDIEELLRDDLAAYNSIFSQI